MKTAKVDSSNRVRLSDLKPGDAYQVHAEGRDRIVLDRLVTPEPKTAPRFILEPLDGKSCLLKVEAYQMAICLRLTAEGLAAIRKRLQAYEMGNPPSVLHLLKDEHLA